MVKKDEKKIIQQVTKAEYKYGFVSNFDTDTINPGLNKDVIRTISKKKKEPNWMLQKRLEELDVSVKSAELQRIPNGTKKLNLFDAKKVLRMLDKFEEDDDVQNVFHNLEMTEDLEKELKLQ